MTSGNDWTYWAPVAVIGVAIGFAAFTLLLIGVTLIVDAVHDWLDRSMEVNR